MIIAFDFDGTITKRNKYPECDIPREGIVECIDKLTAEGHKILIFTCRSVNTTKQALAYYKMLEYLHENEILFDVVNANVDPKIGFNPIKPYWHILVDDSALGWNNDWTGEDIYNMVIKKLNEPSVKQIELITKNNT